MARGITEKDVFAACDALVLAGERPTIERVRQKIGRGSPNTVSPMLDTWFKGLGRRLQDPGAFEPRPDVPEPVMQAAQHFWEVALAIGRADLETQLADSLAPMRAEVAAARQAIQETQSAREAERQHWQAAREQLEAVTERFDAERAAHAKASASAAAAQAQASDLRERLAAAEQQLRDARDQARRDVEGAHERATGAERRAALEIESERSARGRADRRAEAAEKRLDVLQTASAVQLEELLGARLALERAREDHLRQVADAASLVSRLETAMTDLASANLARERAEAFASATQAAVDRFAPLVARSKGARKAPKRTGAT
jgi:hypothetical protein